MTQGTVGTPIVPGVGTGLLVAQPLPPTWLALHRYMRIMGVVAPPHFFGTYNADIFPVVGTCDSVVPRHGWQRTDVASREEILNEIALAEEELSAFMGFNLAPGFVVNELHEYTNPYEVLSVGSGGIGTNNLQISTFANSGYGIQAGIRKVELIGTAATGGGGLEYTDEDSDGYIETAKVTMATTATNVCELKVYVADTLGVPEWEIRHPKKKYISGGNVVFEFDIWLFLSPDLDARFPTTEQFRALDFTTVANLLASVDIYKETVDNTESSVRFFWESGADQGSLVYQDGVLVVRDYTLGEVIPRAATYNSTTGVWDASAWVVGRDPDQVRINYYAGNVSQEFLNGVSCDPLSEMYARAIAYMATARLTRSICSCEGVLKFFDNMQEDLSLVSGSRSHGITVRDLDNPFGTRLGEIMTWRLLGKVSRDKKVEVAVI